MIVLSAAGSNIALNELAPVVLGTEEVVLGVPAGDRLVCVGHATVDETTGGET